MNDCLAVLIDKATGKEVAFLKMTQNEKWRRGKPIWMWVYAWLREDWGWYFSEDFGLRHKKRALEFGRKIGYEVKEI